MDLCGPLETNAYDAVIIMGCDGEERPEPHKRRCIAPSPLVGLSRTETRLHVLNKVCVDRPRWVLIEPENSPLTLVARTRPCSRARGRTYRNTTSFSRERRTEMFSSERCIANGEDGRVING